MFPFFWREFVHNNEGFLAGKQCGQQPILRLSNLQLVQRQRCNRLDRFLRVDENIFVFKTH
jgi:hypothetical protein